MAEARNSDITEWCAGMPLVRQRPLADGERAQLTLEARRLRRLGARILALYPAAVAACAAALAFAAPSSALAQTGLAVAIIVVALIILPVEALLARDAFSRSARLGRDLRAGYVNLFAGSLRPRLRADETLTQLRRARLLPSDDTELSIEVLPASGRVWRVVDEPVERWIVARSAAVAQAPAFASVAAQWLDPIGALGGIRVFGGQRGMSGPEMEEVRRCGRRLRVRLLPFALGFTLWLGLSAYGLLGGGADLSRSDCVRFVFLALAALWTDVHWLRAEWLGRRLGKDARAGHVVILRTERSAGGREGAAEDVSRPGTGGEAAPVNGAPSVMEVLPVSRWVWTENGRPATWRVVSL